MATPMMAAMQTAVIVLRLIGGDKEGKALAVTWEGLQPHLTMVRWTLAEGVEPVEMVPTGSTEALGPYQVPVWVPADKLELWRAEHDVDGHGA